MWKILLIGAFGGAGAISRYLVTTLAVYWFGTTFPIGTLVVNVVGCFLFGLLFHMAQTTSLLSDEWLHGIGVGFLGGLTTFSTFGYETYARLENSLWRAATANVLLNLVLGLLAVWAGISLAKVIAQQI
ncbi:MAG: fluoride efflux transporter CrcB [Planctomycetota bacterium]|nr:fluoride efflux transporter CrcB [Planctomycetota bacterium]